MKRCISLLLSLLLLAALLTGCGTTKPGSTAETEAPSAAGVYRLQTIDGQTLYESLLQMTLNQGYTEEILQQTLTRQGYDPEHLDELITLTLEADGTAAVQDMFYGTYNYAGTWTQEGDKVTLVLDGNTLLCTLNEGVLATSFEGSAITFRKQ